MAVADFMSILAISKSSLNGGIYSRVELFSVQRYIYIYIYINRTQEITENARNITMDIG